MTTNETSIPWWQQVLLGTGAAATGSAVITGKVVGQSVSNAANGDTAPITHATESLAGSAANAVTGLGAIQTLAESLSSPAWWVRIGTGAAGILLVIMGLITILVSSPDGRKVVGTAATMAIV